MTDKDASHVSFLPDFCGTRIVFVVVLVAELLAIVLALALPPGTPDRWSDLAMYSFFIQWVALTCIGVLCLSGPVLGRLTDIRAAFVSYAITLIVTLVVTELAWWVVVSWPLEETYGRGGHAAFVARSMCISAIVCALSLRYLYVQHQWRRQLEAQALAKFQALQARIRPHFFFNCMNTIASLIRREPALAEAAVEDLADLFRASLKEPRSGYTLSDEISLCQRYLRIEKLRLGERLDIVWEVDGAPMDLVVPALTIQPLVENAVYHGIEPLPGGGSIRISAARDGTGALLTIENPVIADKPAQARNQLAQDNVRQRLTAYFGEPGLLGVEAGADRYRVTLRIPGRHEDTDR